MNPLDAMTVRALDLIESMTAADWQRPDVLLKPFVRAAAPKPPPAPGPVEADPEPDATEPTKPKRYRKNMNAREDVLKYFVRHPADVGRSPRDLEKVRAVKAKKSTIHAVQEALREQQKTPAEMLAEIRSGQAGGAR